MVFVKKKVKPQVNTDEHRKRVFLQKEFIVKDQCRIMKKQADLGVEEKVIAEVKAVKKNR